MWPLCWLLHTPEGVVIFSIQKNIKESNYWINEGFYSSI